MSQQTQRGGKPGTILLLTQVYVPDPASVGQHLHDAAAELVRRGHRVKVLASARGYDDPSMKYARRELRDGVEIRRLPLSSFGKSSIPVRVAAGLFLMVQEILPGLFTRNLESILVSTSPPMCPIAAMVISFLRRKPITYWVMDLNPDQMIELGKIRERSFLARVFNWLNRRILKRARRIVALDRFMADRLYRKRDVRDKTTIMPPWPHDDHVEMIDHGDNPWRQKHVEDGRFVIMYSGNHGITSPVTTVLQAALRMQDERDLEFLFVGGEPARRKWMTPWPVSNPPTSGPCPTSPSRRCVIHSRPPTFTWYRWALTSWAWCIPARSTEPWRSDGRSCSWAPIPAMPRTWSWPTRSAGRSATAKSIGLSRYFGRSTPRRMRSSRRWDGGPRK